MDIERAQRPSVMMTGTAVTMTLLNISLENPHISRSPAFSGWLFLQCTETCMAMHSRMRAVSVAMAAPYTPSRGMPRCP